MQVLGDVHCSEIGEVVDKSDKDFQVTSKKIRKNVPD